MTSLDLDLDRTPEPCLVEGCDAMRVEGFHCQAHADWLAGRETPGARAIMATIRAESHRKIVEGAAAIRAATPPPSPTGAAAIVCPHCQVRGRVTSRRVNRKAGISGGKATGALLTGGVSLLATGLSRKVGATAMACGNCGTRWTV